MSILFKEKKYNLNDVVKIVYNISGVNREMAGRIITIGDYKNDIYVKFDISDKFVSKIAMMYLKEIISMEILEEESYTKQDLIDLVESLKDYTSEAHSIIGHDERESEEFVNIFLEMRRKKGSEK